MKKLLVRSGHSPRHRVRLTCEDKSRTLQSAQEECNINNIMANWKRTGIITHGQVTTGKYDDLADIPTDYHESMNQLLAAQDAFASLPATVRKKFNNDPGELLDNMSDPENRQLLIDAGLLNETADNGGEKDETEPEGTVGTAPAPPGATAPPLPMA